MSYADSNVRSVSGTVDLPSATAWSTPQPLRRFGHSGIINRLAFRAPAGSTITEVAVMVYVADEDAVITDPDNEVRGEDRVMQRVGITVTGDDYVSDEDHVFEPQPAYDTEQYQTIGKSVKQKILWIAFKAVAGTAQAGCAYRIYAVQVS